MRNLTPKELYQLEYDWDFWARRNQLPPAGNWRTWLVLAGRGFGKTRTGAETVRQWVESGQYGRIALVAPTAADARDVMIEGESGLMAICPPWNRPGYEPSKRRLVWPNGAMATTYSADVPKRLRGPQHDAAWCDEICAWEDPGAWDMLMFGLRLGSDPRTVVTTTPQPMKLLLDLMAAKTTVITRGSTYENRANLAEQFLSDIIATYEGTRLGRQELLAEVLTDTPGALWTLAILQAAQRDHHEPLMRVVIGVDPAVSATDQSDETGIIAAGREWSGDGVVLGDYTCKASPLDWARRAVNAFWHHQADSIIAEANQGGDMVQATIAQVDPRVPVRLVHASRGKAVRAEPVAALYEQGRIKHLRQAGLDELERQMTSWAPGSMAKSPDRMDALVWAFWSLFVEPPAVMQTVVHDARRMISRY